MDGVIFDMDGVIVDSEHQWRLAEKPFFKRVAPNWRDEYHPQIVGLSVNKLYDLLSARYGLRQTREQFLQECRQIGHEVYSKGVTLAPGLLKLLDDLKAKKIPLGIASSAPRAWINLVVERFSLSLYFTAIACEDDAPGRTKPAPDLYLLAAERLRIPPTRCLAIEDSAIGVLAAKNAGLKIAGFRSGFNDEQDLSKADFEICGFTGRNYTTLLSQLD